MSKGVARLLGSRIMKGMLLGTTEGEVESWRMSARGLSRAAGGKFRLALVDRSSQCSYTTLLLVRGRRRRRGAHNMLTGIPSTNARSKYALVVLQTRESTRTDDMNGAIHVYICWHWKWKVIWTFKRHLVHFESYNTSLFLSRTTLHRLL